MIDLVARTVTLTEGAKAITSFAVWFITPFGLITNLDEAITRCAANDMDPNEVLHAIPVAVTDETYEVLK